MFGEDGKTLTPGEFFGKMTQFCQLFLSAKAENEAAVQKQLDLEKKEREKLDKANQKSAAAKGKMVAATTGKSPDTPAAKDGELDDLITSIKSGKAFFNSDFAPQQRKKSKPAPPSANLGAELGAALAPSLPPAK